MALSGPKMKLYIALLLLCVLAACSPTAPVTPVVGVNNGVAAPAPVVAAPVPELAQPALKVVAKAPAKKSKAAKGRKQAQDKELTARATALINMTRADCLSGAVDKKLDWDVNTNTVHDLGNVITAPVCSAYKLPNANTMAQAKAFIKRQDKAKKK